MFMHFNAAFYLRENPDVLAAVARGETTAMEHFNTFGYQEGRAPNAFFDVSFYLSENPDVLAAGVNPLAHFLAFGAAEGRAPSAAFPARDQFDTAAYAAANPDLGLAGLTTPAQLYEHFVTFGFAEARPGVQTIGGRPEGSVIDLTVFDDALTGNANDNTFFAPISQDFLAFGGPADTLGNNDVLDGAGGRNVLRADLVGNFVATSPTTTNIQEVYLRAQTTGGDSTLDAEKIAAVEQWWTENSRADITIEDIRSAAADTTFGMRNTDSGASYSAFFNANFIADPADTDPTAVNVVLDGVGNGGIGGALNVAAMAGDRGIEVFNVSVDGDSNLAGMASVNADFVTGDQLEIVNLTSVGANGDLTVGQMTDVRTIDGSAFEGALDLNITLTNNAIGRYLDDATETVDFAYTGGVGDDTFNVFVDDGLASDTDFALTVDMGDGDDELRIDAEVASSVSVDGGEGDNTIVVSRSHGLADVNDGESVFASFANFQTYEIEGRNPFGFQSTEHNFASMGGVENVIIATDGNDGRAGDDTQLRNLEAAQNVTVSGANQTTGNSSTADQRFDSVQLTNDTGAARVLTLNNTARADGQLIINTMVIDGTASATRTLDVVSDGARNTSNVVNELDAARVTTLNLAGTQDLDLHVATLATQPVTGGNSPALTVSATDLTGELTLAMNSAMLARGSNDVLRGTAGDSDTLQLYGTIPLIGAAPGTPSAPTVSGFETIQFGAPFAAESLGFQGTYNATNTTGVDLYDFTNLDGATTVSGLAGSVNALVGGDADQDLTFAATTNAASNVLNIEIDEFYNSEIATTNFRTINADLAGDDEDNDFFFFSVAPDATARTLAFTGGGDLGAPGAEGGVDELFLNSPLENTLSVINFAEFVGEIGTVVLVDAAAGASNTTIRLNGYDAFIDDQGDLDPSVGTITTFVLTQDAVTSTGSLVIDGFRPSTGAVTNDLSILDLSALGVSGLGDFNRTDDGGNVVIDSANFDFDITLLGVTTAQLSIVNFSFA